jgi:NADH:ubiquinone oxidoreductase subunit D/NADH:ubiquinone oxidoreductase subunit C
VTAAAGDAKLAAGRALDGLPGITEVEPLGPGGVPCGLTSREELIGVARALKEDRGFDHLVLVTAVDGAGDAGGLDLYYLLKRRVDLALVALKVALDDSSLHAPSLYRLWPGAGSFEREVYDLFGVTFDDHPNLSRIVLRDDFVGHPLRKSYPMSGEGVSREAVLEAVKGPGTASHEPAPASATRAALPPEFDAFAAARKPGDPALRSDRLILNMGPQHPSTHGVLHIYLALEGETVVASQPTHGFLHRCIEKLCENNVYKACTPLLDRCDYVSGFHQELAYMLALEELMGIESTPRADYLRVIFSELVRITSHHTWFTAAGFDTGALTPFLFAFIDREKILDFFETVTGARMMFNYFRPGGVKEDIQPEVVTAMIAYLKTFDRAMDDCESLLTNNEIFRARMRGIGLLTRKQIADYCVTGPLARASGWDHDLRRDAPYAAYDRIPVNVKVGTAGDTYDRYLVRVAEMRESARIALEALEGLPEGPYISPDAPRTLRPPVGTVYREVESPRGELGMFVVSDGSTKPWRLKVRSPAFSNLHVAPALLVGCRVGDVIPALGSVDVVMGEIDR